MRTYVFVDGENHYLRSTSVAAKVFGSPDAAQALSVSKTFLYEPSVYPKSFEGKRFAWNEPVSFFWDSMAFGSFGIGGSFNKTIERAIYVTSCSGDDKVHESQVTLRNYGFEPVVIREQKQHRDQRVNLRLKQGLIDKPKGCDIALATRMVADAAANLYDCCCLFTSDADFLPAVEAVRRMGKVVYVAGYKVCLPDRSPYLHAPDRFYDLGAAFRDVWMNGWPEITAAFNSINVHGPLGPPFPT